MEHSGNHNSLTHIVSEFVKNTTNIFKNTLEIFVLETQLAVNSILGIIIALFVISLLSLTIWIGIQLGASYFLMTIGWQWYWTALLMLGLNLLVMLPIIIYATRAYRNLCFIATRKQLLVTQELKQ